MMTAKSKKSISDDQRLAVVIAAYLRAVEEGQSPDRDELLFRNPELATELSEFFADQDQFDRLMSPLRGSEPTTPFPASPTALGVGAEGYAGHRFGDYELIAEIARGGMGVVFKARSVRVDRTVALKMILAGHLATSADVQRFRAEAQSVAQLDHPNIVPLYEVGDYEGQQYFAMKLIDGGSLADDVSRFVAVPKAAAELLRTVARAVHYAHQRGILHRDLKPANILIDRSGQPHVTDFGLAKRLAGEGGFPSSSAIVGTPSYMAPEYASGCKVLSTAIDVYSLGAILYELLTGRSPFRADTPFDTLLQVVQKEPERPSTINGRVDRDLETICLKCLAKEPERRYGSAEALADDLERWLAGEPIRARRTGTIERFVKWARRRKSAAALVAISALAVVAVVVTIGVKNIEVTQRTKETELALEKYKTALRDQQLALKVAQQTSYDQTIALAAPEVMANNVRRADKLLDTCPAELRHWEWSALKRLCHGETFSMAALAEPASAAFSSDGRMVAAAGGELGEPGFVTIWDADTGREVRSFRGHDDAITGLAFSPSGDRLATSSRDSTVRLWETATGRQALIFRGHMRGVSCLAFSPDGRWIASGGADRTVKLWNASSGSELRSFAGHSGAVWGLAFSPDGRLLSSAGDDQTVKLWDAEKGDEIRTLRGHAGLVHAVAFSPDGRLVASAGYDGTARIWNAADGRELVVFRGHSRFVTGVAFSPDGRYVASASADRTVKLWEAGSGETVLTLRGHGAAVWGVAFRPNGLRIASVSEDRTVKLWDAPALAITAVLRADSEPIRQAALSIDTRRLAVLRGQFTLEVWDLPGARWICAISAGEDRVERFALSADGELIAAVCDQYRGETLRVWSADGGTEKWSLKPTATPTSGLSFSADGRRLAITSSVGRVLIWDMLSGKEVTLREGETTKATGEFTVHQSALFNSAGTRLMLAGTGSPEPAVQALTCVDAATGSDLFAVQGRDRPRDV